MIFIHTYTLVTELQDVIQRDNVIMIDTGHTHYNEVANDGHTIYAATRSTGQATEGPVGFSIINLDNGVISWKFKALGKWPFVMITSPADKRFMIGGSQTVKGTANIRAKIWNDKNIVSATMQIDGGQPVSLSRIGETYMWDTLFDSSQVCNGDHKIRVSVTGAGGNTSEDTITITINQLDSEGQVPRSFGPVDNYVGAYAEKGLLGTQHDG